MLEHKEKQQRFCLNSLLNVFSIFDIAKIANENHSHTHIYHSHTHTYNSLTYVKKDMHFQYQRILIDFMCEENRC